MNDRQLVMRRLRALHRRYTRTMQRVDECEELRSQLYAEARALDPPITYKSIAAVFDVSEAAVMQKERRWKENNGLAAKRGKRAKSA